MNRIASLLAKDYRGDAWIVVKHFEHPGSLLYKVRSSEECAAFKQSLELLVSDGVQIVVLGKPEVYKEYEPYTEVLDSKELFRKALEM